MTDLRTPLAAVVDVALAGLAALVASGLFSTAAPAQTPRLVADIEKRLPDEQAMNPADVTVFRGAVYFAGFTHPTGSELFRSNGVGRAPTLVKDIAAGSESSSPNQLTVFGNLLAFFANGNELWTTDGTNAGTVRVRKSTKVYGPSHVVAAGNRLFFVDPVGELWVSDGTTAGTVKLRSGVRVGEVVALGNTILFAGTHSASGSELWRSDGTAAGTGVLKDINPGIAGSDPHQFGRVGNKLVFTVTGPKNTAHWVSDGTASGTQLLVVTNSSRTVREYSNRALLGTKLYFGASDAAGGGGLWVTSGTKATTKRVATLSATPHELAAHAGKVYFALDTALWGSDGTASGTSQIYQVSGRYLQIRGSSGTHLYFLNGVRTSNGTYYTPFATNGTAAGTSRVAGVVNSHSAFAFPGAGFALFAGRDSSGRGWELFQSNGTSAGTRVVYDYRSPPGYTQSSSAVAMTRLGNFVGGRTRWGAFTSDGTRAGTKELRAVTPLADSPDGALYASDRTGLLRIDPVSGVRTNLVAGQIQRLVPFGDHWYAVGKDSTNRAAIWRTDGAATGTKLLKSFGPYSNAGASVVEFRGFLYFLINSRVWRTDGTVAGTTELRPPNTGSPWHIVGDLAVFGSHLLVSTRLGVVRSDGTVAGSTLLNKTSWRGKPVAFGGAMYFASAGWLRPTLWKTDGTVAGTKIVKALPAANAPTQFGQKLVVHRGSLYFYGNDDKHGIELWISDGTTAGTKILKDIYPGATRKSFIAGSLIAAGDRYVYFVADDGKHGPEMWRTDGTAAGTVMVHDLNPGSRGSQPNGFLVHRGELWFTASDGKVGFEPWTIDIGAVAHRVGHGCAAKGAAPQLSATPPRLGSTLTIDVIGMDRNARASVLAFGIGVTRPAYLGANCSLHIDFSKPYLLHHMVPRGGTARLRVVVPALPSLLGALVPVQAAAGPTGNAPLYLDLTGAMYLAFRR